MFIFSQPVLVLAVAVATLPLRHLVTFYIYLVCAGLMGCAGVVSRAFVFVEKMEQGKMDDSIGHEENTATSPTPSKFPAFLGDNINIERLILHVLAQVFMAAVVAYLMEIKNWVKFTLLAFVLPVFGRLIGVPITELHVIHNFATAYTILLVLFCIFNNLGNIIDICKEGVNFAFMSCRTFGIIPVLSTFWRTMAVPIQLLLFWVLMYIIQVYAYMNMENFSPIWREGWLVVLLASMGECCATPVSLLALCITITYVSWAVLCLTKLYLQGRDAFENDTMRGWTEGFTMLLIAVQTDLLELKPLQRAFLMSILLFIVVSSLIQSMYEVADPVLLTLSASHNRSIVKHVKAVSLFLVLCMFPLYMTYFICQYFDLDFWLMVIVSSCLLTSVQVAGSLVVYSLFMYDFFRCEPWDNLDDIIYCARAITRVMEFIVAVFVVCFGLKESLVGEWSFINSVILIVHCYFNVWQRLQSGWASFLLRWEAVKKVESLPQATAEQLLEHDDVCAICYSEMKTASVTPCGHLFHGLCLRKWLYVKDSCPMCHRDLAPKKTTDNNFAAQEEPNGNRDSDGDGGRAQAVGGQNESAKQDQNEEHEVIKDECSSSSENSCSSSSSFDTEGDSLESDVANETHLAEADQ